MAGDEENISVLLSLPTEMLMAVADRVEPEDLLAMRRCKRLHAAAEDRFCKVFFTKRSHLFIRSSLESLVSITANATFVKHIEEIEFVAVESSHAKLHHHTGEGWEETEDDDKDLEAVWGRESHDVCRENIDWDGSGDDGFDLVQKVFENLVAARVVPAVTACGPCDPPADCFGVKRLEKLGIGFDEPPSGETILSSAVLEAIVDTGFPVASLTLTARSGVPWVCDGQSEGLNQKASELASFQFLNNLTIDLEQQEMLWRSIDPSYLIPLFNSAANLTHLTCEQSLRIIDEPGVDQDRTKPFIVLREMLCASKLTSIILDKIDASLNELKQFLGHFKDTLKTLRLKHVDLDAGSWASMCRWLADEFMLERVDMSYLTVGDRGLFDCGSALADMKVQGCAKGYCVLQGEESVRSGLEVLTKVVTSDDDGGNLFWRVGR